MQKNDFELAHRQVRQELIKLRDGAARATDAAVSVLILLDTYNLTLGTEEAARAFVDMTNAYLDSLRTLTWLTEGEGTRTLPGMATFYLETYNLWRDQIIRLMGSTLAAKKP